MTDLMKKAFDAYNEFELEEYGNDPISEEEFKGVLPILFSSFNTEKQENEVEIQVSYNLDKQEYIVETIDDDGNHEFSIEASLDVFIDDMGADWQSLYEYFVGEARDNFNYDYPDDDYEDDEEDEDNKQHIDNTPKQTKTNTGKFYSILGDRINKKQKQNLRAKGIYAYDLRTNGNTSTVEHSVLVNHEGTLLTNFQVLDDNNIDDYKEDLYAYLDEVGAEYSDNYFEKIDKTLFEAKKKKSKFYKQASAGDPEKNMAMFNHMMGSDKAVSSDGASSVVCEAKDEVDDDFNGKDIKGLEIKDYELEEPIEEDSVEDNIKELDIKETEPEEKEEDIIDWSKENTTDNILSKLEEMAKDPNTAFIKLLKSLGMDLIKNEDNTWELTYPKEFDSDLTDDVCFENINNLVEYYFNNYSDSYFESDLNELVAMEDLPEKSFKNIESLIEWYTPEMFKKYPTIKDIIYHIYLIEYIQKHLEDIDLDYVLEHKDDIIEDETEEDIEDSDTENNQEKPKIEIEDEEETELKESVSDKDINEDFINLLWDMEFKLVKNDNGTFSLQDMQGANLGDIESEEFTSAKEILDRLEGSYIHDYFLGDEDLEEIEDKDYPVGGFDSETFSKWYTPKMKEKYPDLDYRYAICDFIVNKAKEVDLEKAYNSQNGEEYKKDIISDSKNLDEAKGSGLLQKVKAGLAQIMDEPTEESLQEAMLKDNIWFKKGVQYLEKNPDSYGYICSFINPTTKQEVGVAKGFKTKEELYKYANKLTTDNKTDKIKTIFQTNTEEYKQELKSN